MPTAAYPDDLIERARRIRLACFDVDGTLTDGRLHFDDGGHEHKAFHAQDGMGLAIVDAIVQRHSGRVSLDSRPGEGCTVRVFLPDAAPAGVSDL